MPPPDRVFLFFCTGNDMVLIAYETGGCATAAFQIALDAYRSITQSSVECQRTVPGARLHLPDLE